MKMAFLIVIQQTAVTEGNHFNPAVITHYDGFALIKILGSRQFRLKTLFNNFMARRKPNRVNNYILHPIGFI